MFEDVCYFKYLSLFNVIKTELLGVSPAVTKDGRQLEEREEGEAEVEGGEERTAERIIGDNKGDKN